MSTKTTNFDLVKPAQNEILNVDVFNGNMDIIDAEMAKPPLTVNNVRPNATTRNLYLEKVPLSDNLASDIAQLNSGVFVQRTSGGSSSIETGAAFLQTLKGNMVHTGYVEEVLNMTVNAMEDSTISATIDRATFIAYVTSSATITLTYSTEWSANPATYGITVTGTPLAGDSITVEYIKEDRGTITVTTPVSFKATGWNLYNNTDGYARVVAYSSTYGYRVGGSYTMLEFAETLTSEHTTITPEDGLFNVPSDGYVFVSGGNNTTFIYPTWTTWVDNYVGNFQTYTVYTVDLSEVMLLFPYGLMAVGDVKDEISLTAQKAYNRIERLAYTAENLAAVIASGVAYECDTNYIYAVLESATETDIDLSGSYMANDHGIEFFEGTSVGVDTQILYGENLKDKLRTDVVTLSQQTLTTQQKTQVQTNLGLVPTTATNKTTEGFVADARAVKTVYDNMNTFPFIAKSYIGTYNLNTFTDGGVYFVSGTLTNCPYGTNGALIVLDLNVNDWVKQIWLRMGTPGSNDNRIYTRAMANGTWGDWCKYEGTIVT